jgi:uncharacterized protein (TIGR00251 family)
MPFIFDVKVMPSAGRQSWKLDKSGILRCYLKSAPERGKANLELIKFIAKGLKLTNSEVEITAGATSRNKRIKVHADLDYAQLLDKLGIVVQQNIFK